MNGVFLVAQMVKNLPAMQKTWAHSLGREDPLEKEMATHSSVLAWKILWTEESVGLQSMGLQYWTWVNDWTLSHTWVWELDHKECWAPKNRYFWIVLKKTLESPLDSKEIKPINPKGNKPWVFLERNVAKVEAPTLWPLMWRADSLESPWRWERLKAEGEEGSRGWDG